MLPGEACTGSRTVSQVPELFTHVAPFDLPIDEDRGDLSIVPPRTVGPKFRRLRRGGRLEADTAFARAGDIAEPIGGLPKRLLDIAIAATALTLLAPLMLFVALLIRLTMGRPILFSQRRAGVQGRQFTCLKFRTMVSDADAALRLHLVNNSQAALEWQMRQKLQHDPRVTALGRLLRRSSIDELPQLICVLKGDMSCVGPRPIVEEEVVRYGPYWLDCIKAKPGLTGEWQVSGRSRLSYERRVALDRYYVRRWSFWRDVWVLMRTIPAVFRTDDAA